MEHEEIGTPFGEALRIEFLVFLRSMSFKLLMVFWFVILTFFCITVLSNSIIGNAFSTSGIITQALITGGITLGAIIASEERRNRCDEMLSSIEGTYRCKILAKVVFLVIVGFFIMMSAVLTVFILFFFLKAEPVYYASSAAFMALYWIIPFLTAGMFGCFCSFMIHTRAVYVVTTILSLVLGPILPEILAPLFMGGWASLDRYLLLFNMGPIDLHSPMSESYGYCLNPEVWTARVCILTGACFLVMSMMTDRHRERSVKRLAGYVAAVTVLFFGFVLSQYVYMIQSPTYRFDELITYYKNNPEPDFERAEYAVSDVYEIASYRIRLDDGLKLKIKADIDIEVRDGEKKLIFTLFHGFVVNECSIDGTACNYETAGDALMIENHQGGTGHHILTLCYEGLPPGNLYKAGNKWVLPGMFAWIPVEYVGKTMKNETLATELFNYPGDKKAVPMQVEYTGNHEVFCSLEGEDDFWSGCSNGITIACGWFGEKTVDGISVVYPLLSSRNPEQAATLMKGINELLPVLYDEMMVEHRVRENDKVFIFPSIYSQGMNDGVYFIDDHVILCLYYDQKGNLIENMNVMNIIEGAFRSDGWTIRGQDYLREYVVALFKAAYSDSLYYRGKNDYENIVFLNSGNEIARLKESAGDVDFTKMARFIDDIVSKGMEEEQLEMLRKYRDLLDNEMDTKLLIDRFLEEFDL